MSKNYISKLLEWHGSIFIFCIFILAILAIDSSIVKSFGYSSSRLPGFFDQLYYSIFVLIFIIGNYVLLTRSKNIVFSYKKSLHKLTILPKIMEINQYIIAGILITIIIQMFLFSYYYKSFLLTIIFISFIASIFFSLILVLKFIQWFKFNKNKYLLLYIIAFLLILIKSSIAIVYLTQELNSHQSLVKLQQTRSMLMNLSNINAVISNLLKISYNYLSIFSYIAIWLTTSLMLKQYSAKFGRAKFWILIAVPLVGFIALENINKVPIFRELILLYPHLYGLFSSIMPTIFQLVLAILFGLGLLNTAKIINEKKLSLSLFVSALGIMILIGSQEIFGVYVGAYPPYGLVSVSFMGLGSYLLFLGVITSSINITKNIKIRDDIILKIENSNLLKDIGITEWNIEIEKSIKKITHESVLKAEKPDPSPEELQNLMNNIVDELKKRRFHNNKIS